MVYLILGVIIGMLVSLLVVFVATRHSSSVTRTLNQIQSKSKKRGAVIEPEAEELTDWVKSIEHEMS